MISLSVFIVVLNFIITTLLPLDCFIQSLSWWGNAFVVNVLFFIFRWNVETTNGNYPNVTLLFECKIVSRRRFISNKFGHFIYIWDDWICDRNEKSCIDPFEGLSLVVISFIKYKELPKFYTVFYDFTFEIAWLASALIPLHLLNLHFYSSVEHLK